MVARTVTTITGASETVCMPRLTTCAALNDFYYGQCFERGTGDCGLPGLADGDCRLDMTRGSRLYCSVPCEFDTDCPNRRCNPSSVPPACLF